MTESGYATIVADPPWPYGDANAEYSVLPSTGRTVSDWTYKPMSLDDIVALPVKTLAAKNAHLYLWVTNAFMEEGHQVVRAWGFRPKTILTWVKTHKGDSARVSMKTGYYFRGATEHIIFAVRGSLKTNDTLPTAFMWPRIGEHSVKPDAFYDMVEQMSPPEYVELFARRHRLGWDVWGDQSANTAHLLTMQEEDEPVTMTEIDAIEPIDTAAEIAQSAMFSDEEIERSAPVFLPGFEDLGRLQGQPIFDDTEVIDAAMAYYRERGFPYRSLPVHVSMQQINQLSATDSKNLLGTVVGYQVADTYHPHRFHSAAAGAKSPLESFESDKQLRRAIEKTLKHGAVGEEFLGMMAIVAGTQACSNFRPGFALSYYRRYCQRGGEVVLDTSTGYGGRLVGFLASNTRGTYIGIDPNVPTHKGNALLMRELGVPKGYRALLINLPAEDVPVDSIDWEHSAWMAPDSDVRQAGGVPFVSHLRESCDFAFTSPPYFSKERYSEDATQSWKRYGDDPEHWRQGFLVPMMRLQFAALKPGAYSCVNVADVKVGNQFAPLSEWTRAAGIEAGFTYINEDKYRLTRRMGAGATNGVVAYEPVHVFQKPEPKIQIVKEGPVTTADIAATVRQVTDDTLCADSECGHRYVKHDEDDGGTCLLKSCPCVSFQVPWCLVCYAESGQPHLPTCEYAPSTDGQLAAGLVHVERPIEDHVLCGMDQCGHSLAKHDDDEGECLKKGCVCERFEYHCPDCGRREGERHAEGCATSEGGVTHAEASEATQLAERLQEHKGAPVEREVAQAESALERAQVTPTPAAPDWLNCPVEDCVRTDKHVPGDACQRGHTQALQQSEIPVAVTRRPAAPPPAEPVVRPQAGSFSMYGPPTEHCPERVEDNAERPLSGGCRGCGAPRAHWCNRDK